MSILNLLNISASIKIRLFLKRIQYITNVKKSHYDFKIMIILLEIKFIHSFSSRLY